MGGEKGPKTTGETGFEDDILLSMFDEMDGATVAEIKEFFKKQHGKEVDEVVLKTALDKLVSEGHIEWDEKLRGYVLKG